MRMKMKGDSYDFECGRGVGEGQAGLSILENVDLLRFSPHNPL